MPYRPRHKGAVVNYGGRKMSVKKFNRLHGAKSHPRMNDLKFESDFWGSCCNTFDEERKQFVYADLMGIKRVTGGPRLDEWGFDTKGKRILDIGGGPVSMLLKGVGLISGIVVDPLVFPDWVTTRYDSKNIELLQAKGEDLFDHTWIPEDFDEVWIYNVLQHVDDPVQVIANAKKAGKLIRIFEWIDIPAYPGHPQMLTKERLEEWLGGKGDTQYLSREGCQGRCFYGVFATAGI